MWKFQNISILFEIWKSGSNSLSLTPSLTHSLPIFKCWFTVLLNFTINHKSHFLTFRSTQCYSVVVVAVLVIILCFVGARLGAGGRKWTKGLLGQELHLKDNTFQGEVDSTWHVHFSGCELKPPGLAVIDVTDNFLSILGGSPTCPETVWQTSHHLLN